MAKKSANLYARIEPDVKEKAESILAALGIPASNAINIFYKQIILQRGLPFEVKMPPAKPVNINTLSETEFNEELEKYPIRLTAICGEFLTTLQLTYNHPKAQADNLTVWKNRY